MSKITRQQGERLKNRLDEVKGFDPSIRQLLCLPKPGYSVEVRTDISETPEYVSLEVLSNALRDRYGFPIPTLTEIESLLRGMRAVAIDLPSRVHMMVDVYAHADPDVIVDRYIEKNQIGGPRGLVDAARTLEDFNHLAKHLFRHSPDIRR